MPAPTPLAPLPTAPVSSDTDLRIWTDSTGHYQVTAHFVCLSDRTVRLHKADGGYTRISYNQLCESDRKFVLELLDKTLAN